MAGRAHSVGIAVRSREPRVIERRSTPATGGMARFTRRGKSDRRVHRIRRTRVIRSVTGIASRVRELVVVVRVARLARRRRVSPRQWKFCIVVIE